MLHPRLLIGFLNVSLRNTVIFFCRTNQKTCYKIKWKIKPLKSLISPSLSFLKTVSYEGPNIYDIHTERRWGGLKICSCLWILLFLCSFLRMKSGCGGKKLVIFCGRKISLLSICTFRMKSNLTFLIFKNGTKTHKQILPWMKKLKTCHERPHLICSVEWFLIQVWL